MKYYVLTENPEVVGKRQIIPMMEYDVELRNAEGRLTWARLPAFEPTFSNLYIDRATKVIDNVSAIGGVGFILNRELIDLLSRVDVGAHRVYPLETYFWESRERVNGKYSWLQLVSQNFEKWIDYDKSSFVINSFFGPSSGESRVIRGPADLKKALEECEGKDADLTCTRLQFSISFPRLDLFYLRGLHIGSFQYPFCSERLKQALEKIAPDHFLFKEVPA